MFFLQGVTIPSQRRYVEYFEKMLTVNYHLVPMRLRTVELEGIQHTSLDKNQSFSSKRSLSVFIVFFHVGRRCMHEVINFFVDIRFKVYSDRSKEPVYKSDVYSVGNRIKIHIPGDVVVSGDTLVVFYSKSPFLKVCVAMT